MTPVLHISCIFMTGIGSKPTMHSAMLVSGSRMRGRHFGKHDSTLAPLFADFVLVIVTIDNVSYFNTYGYDWIFSYTQLTAQKNRCHRSLDSTEGMFTSAMPYHVTQRPMYGCNSTNSRDFKGLYRTCRYRKLVTYIIKILSIYSYPYIIANDSSSPLIYLWMQKRAFVYMTQRPVLDTQNASRRLFLEHHMRKWREKFCQDNSHHRSK